MRRKYYKWVFFIAIILLFINYLHKTPEELEREKAAKIVGAELYFIHCSEGGIGTSDVVVKQVLTNYIILLKSVWRK